MLNYERQGKIILPHSRDGGKMLQPYVILSNVNNYLIKVKYNMKLKHLRSFVLVAGTAYFSVAASRLCFIPSEV